MLSPSSALSPTDPTQARYRIDGETTIDGFSSAELQDAIDRSLVESYPTSSQSVGSISLSRIRSIVKDIIKESREAVSRSTCSSFDFNLNYSYQNTSRLNVFQISFVCFSVLFGRADSILQSVGAAYAMVLVARIAKICLTSTYRLLPERIKCSVKHLASDILPTGSESKTNRIKTLMKIAFVVSHIALKSLYHAIWGISIASLLLDQSTFAALLCLVVYFPLIKADFSNLKNFLDDYSVATTLRPIDRSIPPKFSEDEELKQRTCPLTQEPILYPIKSSCGHRFEANPAFKWFLEHKTCPICRAKLKDSDIVFDRAAYIDISARIKVLSRTSL